MNIQTSSVYLAALLLVSALGDNVPKTGTSMCAVIILVLLLFTNVISEYYEQKLANVKKNLRDENEDE